MFGCRLHGACDRLPPILVVVTLYRFLAAGTTAAAAPKAAAAGAAATGTTAATPAAPGAGAGAAAAGAAPAATCDDPQLNKIVSRLRSAVEGMEALRNDEERMLKDIQSCSEVGTVIWAP